MTTAAETATLESTKCLLCGVDDTRPLLKRSAPRHVVCRRCGLVYQNPRPTPAAIAEHYQSRFWEERGEITFDAAAARNPVYLKRGRAVVEWTRGYVGAEDLAVEIGCGHGEIISYVRDQLGCQVIGVEPSPAQAAAAVQRYQLVVQMSDLEGADLIPGSVKLLVLTHVAEHLHDPRAALVRCASLLVNGGWLFIEVPNILTPDSRKRLSTWLSREHLYYFSPQSLERVLRQSGFAVEQSAHTGFVRFLARKCDSVLPDLDPRNEYWRVRRALWLHELSYWPKYAAKRLGGMISNFSRD